MFPSFHMMRYMSYVNDIQERTRGLVECLETLLPYLQNMFEELESQGIKLVICLKILKLILSSL